MRLLGLSLIFITLSSFAMQLPAPNYQDQAPFSQIPAKPHFYGGVQFGYGDNNYTKNDFMGRGAAAGGQVTSLSEVQSRGVATRLFAGLQINRYLASELAYFYLPQIELKNVETSNFPGQPANMNFVQQMLSLTGKLIIPVIPHHFALYLDGGAAWVNRSAIDASIGDDDVVVSRTVNFLRPMFGGGAQFNVTRNLLLQAEFDQIQGAASLQNMHFYGLGVMYIIHRLQQSL